jgi:hypothetical protein
LAPSFSPVAARSVLLLTVLLAAAVSVGLAGVSAGIDPDLVRLLRAMAAIKTMMAVAAAAAIWWRLGSPIGGVRLVAYGVAVASMASGPALIWSMVHLAVGAALLHGGLFASLILLWRDPAVSQRLQSLITRRRRTAATMAERGDF